MLYYSCAYPYFMYSNHMWGNNYQINLEKLVYVKKTLVTTITIFFLRVHSEPLLYANRIVTVTNIMYMLEECWCTSSKIFTNFYQYRWDWNEHNIRNVDDLNVLYGGRDIRWFTLLNLCRAKPGNCFPTKYQKLPYWKESVCRWLCVMNSDYFQLYDWFGLTNLSCNYPKCEICHRICDVSCFVLLPYSVCCKGRIIPYK